MIKACLLILTFFFIACGPDENDQTPQETSNKDTSETTETQKASSTEDSVADSAKNPPSKTKKSAYIYNKTDHTLRVIISKQLKDIIALIDIEKCLNLTQYNEESNPIVEVEIQALYSDGDVDQVCSICDISQTTLVVDETYWSWVTTDNFSAKPELSIPAPCVLQNQQTEEVEKKPTTEDSQ